MGQAKTRGTFEQRQAAAIERNAESMARLKEERRKHWASLSREERVQLATILGFAVSEGHPELGFPAMSDEDEPIAEGQNNG